MMKSDNHSGQAGIPELTNVIAEVAQLTSQLFQMHKELIILRRNVEELQQQQVGGNNHFKAGADNDTIK